MTLAIIVPFKNRENYLKIFLEMVPKYLEQENNIKDYCIYISEQDDSDTFNLSVSRNVGAKLAITEGNFEHLIFHDVDTIPISGINYHPGDCNIGWFMTAGMCKIHTDTFKKINGYNPHFSGWGQEDTEFYDRLSEFKVNVDFWNKLDESKNARMYNLELSMSEDQAFLLSKEYFGHNGIGPCYVPYPQAPKHVRRDFFAAVYLHKNLKLLDRVLAKRYSKKMKYFLRNGMNLVDITKIFIKERTKNLVWITYKATDVYKEAYSPNKGLGLILSSRKHLL